MSTLDAVRAAAALAAILPEASKVDADLSAEAGTDDRLARLLQAARTIDANTKDLTYEQLLPIILRGARATNVNFLECTAVAAYVDSLLALLGYEAGTLRMIMVERLTNDARLAVFAEGRDRCTAFQKHYENSVEAVPYPLSQTPITPARDKESFTLPSHTGPRETIDGPWVLDPWHKRTP